MRYLRLLGRRMLLSSSAQRLPYEMPLGRPQRAVNKNTRTTNVGEMRTQRSCLIGVHSSCTTIVTLGQPPTVSVRSAEAEVVEAVEGGSGAPLLPRGTFRPFFDLDIY